jgi:hypothetical protein
VADKPSGTVLFLCSLGRFPVLDAWNRAAHYRDLAEECRRLATITFSTQMRNRYSEMADQYSLLAEELGALAYFH